MATPPTTTRSHTGSFSTTHPAMSKLRLQRGTVGFYHPRRRCIPCSHDHVNVASLDNRLRAWVRLPIDRRARTIWKMHEVIEPATWLRARAPTLWSMLTLRARGDLPDGLRQYFRGSERDVRQGHTAMLALEQILAHLVTECGPEEVRRAYRSDLSTVKDMQRLAELGCEAAVLSRFAEVSDAASLQPPTGTGTKCDGGFVIGPYQVFVECKRYHDRWPWRPGDDAREPSPVRHRLLVPTRSESVPPGTDRPRCMDLTSKLARVPLQFPAGHINLLVVFHRSISDGWRDLQQALFGGEGWFREPPAPPLETDGLFSVSGWETISGVALFEMPLQRGPFIRFLWANPRGAGIPDAVAHAVARLAEPVGDPIPADAPTTVTSRPTGTRSVGSGRPSPRPLHGHDEMR